MKVKVSDYIADFLISKGLTQVFTVVGGGAMHLNDSFGHNPGIHCLYHHHEQACAMAAEAYARVSGKMGVVCVTSGPGGINAMNGVAGAYMDSIPMLVISGQMKRCMTTRYTGMKVRSLGSQEFDIVSAADGMTKYAEMITDENEIAYHMEKAYQIAISGRPGPCWLDIPLDVQGAFVETDELKHFTLECEDAPPVISDEIYQTIIDRIEQAKRPVFYAGNGIRIGNAIHEFRELIERFNLPVVTCWNSIDLIENEDVHFCGRGGTMGDRAGNFAVQNSDLLLCVGTRLGTLQVGYDIHTWAREAYTIVVDIDNEELKKSTIRVDLPVCTDAAAFMKKLCSMKTSEHTGDDSWLKQCNVWKEKYPVVQSRHFAMEERANVYAFMEVLSGCLPEGAQTVVANGSASVVGSQSYYIKKDSRFIMNCAISSMGYDLPASIGAAVAAGGKDIYCIAGDGSIMMNLQELQTIVTNHLPVKIFIINNDGYHQIRQTQNNIFHNGLVGVGPESGDLGFPDFAKLANAFGMEYLSIQNNGELEKRIKQVIAYPGGMICEVFVTTTQVFEPKSATKKLEDGSLVSPPLEDLAPFLSREELKENMMIPLVDEK